MRHPFPYAILIATAATFGPAPSSLAADEDCGLASDLEAKEACYAALPQALIDECEAIRPFRCAPYREMHTLSATMNSLVEQLATSSAGAYADYATADQAYVDDLVTAIRNTDHAWRTWRDAECTLAPYLDGMSRREAADLTEACRAGKTQTRIEELRTHIGEMEASDE